MKVAPRILRHPKGYAAAAALLFAAVSTTTGCGNSALEWSLPGGDDAGLAAPDLMSSAPTDMARADLSKATDLGESDASPHAKEASMFLMGITTGVAGSAQRSARATADFMTGMYMCPSRVVMGSCYFMTYCQNNGMVQDVSAGVVSIHGGRPDPITLSEDAIEHFYLYSSPAGHPFLGGEAIEFDATGADAPAFFARLVAPTEATVTEPALIVAKNDYVLNLDRSNDLSVRWHGGSGDGFNFAVVARFESVECTFPTADGHGTIPHQLLSLLGNGAHYVAASTFGELSRTNANVHYYVQIRLDAVTGDGGGYHATATLK